MENVKNCLLYQQFLYPEFRNPIIYKQLFNPSTNIAHYHRCVFYKYCIWTCRIVILSFHSRQKWHRRETLPAHAFSAMNSLCPNASVIQRTPIWEQNMPIFEYKCNNCDTEFEELVFDRDECPPCPKCNSDKTDKLMSAVRSRTGGASGSAGEPEAAPAAPASSGCAGCSGGDCSSCH